MVREHEEKVEVHTHLGDDLHGLQNGELEGARRYYNGNVKAFNTKIEVFPSNLVAKGMGEDYKKRPYFELDSAEERQNVKVSF